MERTDCRWSGGVTVRQADAGRRFTQANRGQGLGAFMRPRDHAQVQVDRLTRPGRMNDFERLVHGLDG